MTRALGLHPTTIAQIERVLVEETRRVERELVVTAFAIFGIRRRHAESIIAEHELEARARQRRERLRVGEPPEASPHG